MRVMGSGNLWYVAYENYKLILDTKFTGNCIICRSNMFVWIV